MTSIKAQLEVAREQLLNYEGIEKEIDEAIMKAGSYEN
jgi:progesterone-induced-blocking factor 1